ncbi:hypothetical protein shim_06910 [Shimia sp. SK013]|uniref:hypothetical protein n=1 Tax=Shimia sp. SK013 TaxID=1389006 RepID=UPI0006B5E39E|nr:hypothetical protein [Shimia sp. SK013]KPA22411.1 hypothetical protein shim_06910 [Shimia sp. SK013]
MHLHVKILNGVYCVQLTLLSVIGFFPDDFPYWLSKMADTRITRCRELLSSGSDASVEFLLLITFVVPLVSRLARVRSAPSTLEFVFFTFASLSAAFAIWLISLDCASDVIMMFWDPEAQLILFFWGWATLSLIRLPRTYLS